MQWGDKKERKTNLIITKFLELKSQQNVSQTVKGILIEIMRVKWLRTKQNVRKT